MKIVYYADAVMISEDKNNLQRFVHRYELTEKYNISITNSDH